ncbi:OmpA family protein [Photobacterium sp. 53610]|uniref:OmpA family protein n=1 Tax=Photobacterium sp. 53610 TaxID=3102789 RepID=UPI002ED839AF
MENKNIDKVYYLFSAKFNREDKNEKLSYVKWHEKKNLTEETELKNIRPISLIPVLSRNDKDEIQIWATDIDYRLCTLGHGNQGAEGDRDVSRKILEHSSPVKNLTCEKYKLNFPPLPVLARLAQGETNFKDLGEKLIELSNKVSNQDVDFHVTEIGINQLADAYELETDGSISVEKKRYNDWLDKVKKLGKPLKGFLLPVFSTCAVTFSSKDYLNATVSLHLYDEEGKDKFKGNVTAQVIQSINDVDRGSNPCAIFHLDPEIFVEGIYTIKVSFDPINVKPIPDSISQSNIRKEKNGRNVIYSYELREYIRFMPDSPLGKIAIVNGDMISLEETLIYQFPQFLKGMKKYLSDEKGSEGTESPTLNGLSTLKSVRDASVQLGAGYLTGGLQEQYIQDGKIATFNSVSQIFWDSLQKDMPEAMRATGELYFGLFSVKEAWNHYRILSDKSVSAAEKGLGVKSLFAANVIDPEKIKEYVQGFKDDLENKNYKALSGRLAESWFMSLADVGISALSTAESFISLNEQYKQLLRSQSETISRRKDLSDIADDYLNKIPVIQEKIYQDAEKINKAISEAKEKVIENSLINDYSDIKDQVELITDEKGTGLRVLFHFNSRQKELLENKSVIDILVEALKSESHLRIEIEGHACQVSSEAINMKVSRERAENTKALFPESMHKFISVKAYGESAPIYEPEDPSEIRKDNPKLAVNRRVVVRIYLASLDIVYSPSRFGSQAMERYRLSAINAMKNEDDAETALKLAILDSFLNIAQFIPLLAPMARGVMLINETTGVLKSAITLLDETLLDNHIQEYFSQTKKIDSLMSLSELNMELLKEIRSINLNLNKKHNSFEEALVFLKDEKTRKELLKRFKLRAYAINGLMYIIAAIKLKSEVLDKDVLEKYKVKDYINRFIINDSWSIPPYAGNMGYGWVNQHEINSNLNMKKSVESKESEAYVAPLPKSKGVNLYPNKNSIFGDFNRVFPVQTKLFEHGGEELFIEFANNFSIVKGYIREEDIGFCRLLVAEPNSNEWKTYYDWSNESKSNRLSPYHKVMLQLVLNTKYDKIAAVKLGYDRVDGVFNCNGPSFDALIYPMKFSDFTCDPDGELAEYYKSRKDEVLSAIEFTPFYYFGESQIYGFKPLTSEGRITFNSIIDTATKMKSVPFYISQIVAQKLGWSEQEKVTDFDLYVSEGNFRNMQYGFWLADCEGEGKLFLAKRYNSLNSDVDAYSKLNKDLKVGVHGEDKTKVLVYRDIGEDALILREKDTLNELFTMTTDVKKTQPLPIIEDIVTNIIGIKSKETGLKLFNESGELKDFYLSRQTLADKRSFSDFSPIEENPTSVFVMFVAENDNIDYYKKTNLVWNKIDMSIQLVFDGDDQKLTGPNFYAPLCFQGKLSFNQYYKNMNKSYGTSYDVWRLKDDLSDGGKVHYSDELQSFVKEAMTRVRSDVSDLDEDKIYTIYAMEVPLSYISPTGRKVKGLRPFGDILCSGTVKLSVDVSQMNTANSEIYSGIKEIDIEIPSIGQGIHYAPWLKEPKPTEEMDKDAFERWKLLSKSEKKSLVQAWIKEQKDVIEAPITQVKLF